MKEISRGKRLEIAHYYVLGHTYGEIEEETGVSHGSIANIVQELENGELTIPGIPFDQVNDLRQLSFDLKKKGLQPSQALLGLALFERLRTLEITPENLDSWAEIIKRFDNPDFSPKDYFEAGLRLHELEHSQGKPFETLAEEYVRLREAVEKLKAEVDFLANDKTELAKEIGPLRPQLESLERAKNKLENEVGIQTTKLRELKLKVKEAEEDKARIDRDTKDLQRRKAKLSSEVDGKEESLRKLDEIGLSNEDLLRLTSFIERTIKNEGLSGNQVRQRFFSALSLFEEVSGLESKRKAEMEQVAELIEKQSVLSGQIFELEKGKGILEGEIDDNVLSTSQRIIDVGEKAASQLQQQVDNIGKQLNRLFEDTLRVGEIVGEMQQMIEKGENAGQSLKDFLEETRSRLGAS
jgi:DNA repair exonuclease SbcCD ATPase subunit